MFYKKYLKNSFRLEILNRLLGVVVLGRVHTTAGYHLLVDFFAALR